MEFLKLWEILLRRKWIAFISFIVFFASVAICTYIINPTYKAKAKIHIETSDSLSSIMSKLGVQNMGIAFVDNSDEHETDIALATIRPLIKKLISDLSLEDSHGKPLNPDKLLKSSIINKILSRPTICVEQYEDADILEIESTSTNPSQAADMSNKLAELYIKDRIEQTRKKYRDVRMSIGKQIQKVKDEYYKSLNDVKDFKVKNEIIDLDQETQNLINKIVTLEGSYEENERTILGLEREMAKTREKINELNMFRKESYDFTQSDQVASLKTRLNSLLVDIAQRSVEIKKEHPDYIQLEKMVEAVRDLIQDETRLVFNSERFSVDPVYDDLSFRLVEDYINKEVTLAKSRLIKEYIKKYQDELLRMPQRYLESSKFKLSLSVNEATYQSLLEYLTHVGIAESMAISNICLVEPAEISYRPHFPKKALNFLLGIFLGFFWGLAVAFFVEYIDNTIKSSEDIKNIKFFPILGIIPRTNYLMNMGTILKADPKSNIVEAFRTIRNNIQYTFADKSIKTIAITSSIENEGKSTLASNISIIMSKTDKKVILIDLNLRRPSLHRFFDLSHSTGIIDGVAKGMQLEEVIVHTDTEKLDLLTAGLVPSDPSSLIESKRLRNTILKLEKIYDMIIIDTPPIMTVNDAIVIGRFVDCVLYVIESGKVPFPMLETIKEEMEKAEIKSVGTVLNKADYYGSIYYGYRSLIIPFEKCKNIFLRRDR
ncbi:MAG: polysaccharide biosynthesis tyrosine autokinase [Thermodesulfobacteriota bacterium]|nr:polysaccharide biosynthesis tyrosine autokinase [Thermodesulfobacteriota bacterium]